MSVISSIDIADGIALAEKRRAEQRSEEKRDEKKKEKSLDSSS